ncbi:MAG: amino acid transport protein [Myxococcales bacterium]|nr:amino acid transport protein [Myxococcales bacterium]
MDGAALLVSMLVGLVGFAIFVYGKRQSRLPHLLAGVVMMLYPYFVDSAAFSAGIAVAVGGALFAAVRLGA